MIKFESDNIIVGFIKNFLHDFKLPTPKIYIDDKYCIDGQLYIKDDFICMCDVVSGKPTFKPLFRYVEDGQLNNYYDNLKFTGISYDSETHRYLGNYLRYLRDYKDLNLMSLYNCYSNEFAEDLHIYKDNELIFTTDDKNYKYLMLPVKLDKEYTIAIDSSSKYDIFCTLYGRSLYYDDYNIHLFDATHRKIPGSSFGTPFIYTSLIQVEKGEGQYFNEYNLINTYDTKDLYKKISECEKDLKMIIRLPATNNSSIVVLEGNYINNNNFIFNTRITDKYLDPFKIQNNYSVINFKPYLEENEELKANEINLVSGLQLLKLNTTVNYPFADRLIEYLTGNTITNIENISDNIKRVQWSLYNEWLEKQNLDLTTTWGKSSLGPNYGIWSDELKLYFYNLAKAKNLLNEKTDILAYVDKDIESNLGAYVNIYKED